MAENDTNNVTKKYVGESALSVIVDKIKSNEASLDGMDAELDNMETLLKEMEAEIKMKSDDNHTHSTDDITNFKTSLASAVLAHDVSTTAHNDIRALIEGITTSKVNVADITDNLTTNVTNKPLSAAQGVAIKGLIEDLQLALDTHNSTHAPSNAQPNQNAFSNIKVGSTTIAADTVTDTLELVGNNVTITPDATNDKVTIAVTDASTTTKGIVQLTDSISSTSTTTAATPNSVRSVYNMVDARCTEMEAFMADKADSVHKHSTSDITGLSANLALRVPITRTINGKALSSDITLTAEDLGISGGSSDPNAMSAINPTGTGSLSINRLSGSTVGTNSIAVGTSTEATGINSHAEGHLSKATGESSHAEGHGVLDTTTTPHTYYCNTASGTGSHAEGYLTKATGDYSHAEGGGDVENGIACYNEARGESSHVEGKRTIAIGSYSHAEGGGTTAVGIAAHASGANTTAIGNYSYAGGGSSQSLRSLLSSEESLESFTEEAIKDKWINNDKEFSAARGNCSHVEGLNNLAIGEFSHVEGRSNLTMGDASHAEGEGTTASAYCSHAEGYQTNAAGKYSHSEGYGTSTTIKLTGDASATTYTVSAANSEIRIGRVLQYGTTYAKITAYDSSALTVTVSPTLSSSALSSASVTLHRSISYGQESHSEGYYTTASGEASHAEGYDIIASGNYSHAEGRGNTAGGSYSHAEGYENYIFSPSTDYPYAGYASHAEGRSNSVNGQYSHVEGYNNIALYDQHVQGHFNSIAYSSSNEAANSGISGAAFMIGNGVGIGAEDRSNAFRVNYDGKVYTYRDGAYNTSGADYAEFFEWQDLNIRKEDRRGYFVTLDGEKIKIAEPSDYILGIVSSSPGVIGNSDEDWCGRYILDEFGSAISEEFEYEEEIHEEIVNEETGETTIETKTVAKTGTRYKQNPDYDPTLPYVQRADRPEWATVGMMGVLHVRDDGTCQVNGFCKVAEGGIATASENGYRVIKRVNDNIVKVVFR